MLYWACRAGIGWLVPLAGEVIWWIADGNHHAAHLAGLIVTVLLAVAHLAVMPQWRYRVHRWETTDDAVYTQAGWFNQERRIAPVARIQTVDSERGALERMFGLANVTVTTASAAGPLKISGLLDGDAQRLVSEMMENTRTAGDDAT